MPRGPRLDAPGVLHNVLFRGIERCKVFIDDLDREGFLERLENVCAEGRAFIYAWCLMTSQS
jgi:putative transposase